MLLSTRQPRCSAYVVQGPAAAMHALKRLTCHQVMVKTHGGPSMLVLPDRPSRAATSMTLERRTLCVRACVRVCPAVATLHNETTTRQALFQNIETPPHAATQGAVSLLADRSCSYVDNLLYNGRASSSYAYDATRRVMRFTQLGKASGSQARPVQVCFTLPAGPCSTPRTFCNNSSTCMYAVYSPPGRECCPVKTFALP